MVVFASNLAPPFGLAASPTAGTAINAAKLSAQALRADGRALKAVASPDGLVVSTRQRQQQQSTVAPPVVKRNSARRRRLSTALDSLHPRGRWRTRLSRDASTRS